MIAGDARALAPIVDRFARARVGRSARRLHAREPRRDGAGRDAPPAAPLPAITSSSHPADDRAARERAEAVLRCRQQRCAHLGKACLDNCHRHGHPRDPEGHSRCNESCRTSHGIETCEAECERDPAAKR